MLLFYTMKLLWKAATLKKTFLNLFIYINKAQQKQKTKIK